MTLPKWVRNNADLMALPGRQRDAILKRKDDLNATEMSLVKWGATGEIYGAAYWNDDGQHILTDHFDNAGAAQAPIMPAAPPAIPQQAAAQIAQNPPVGQYTLERPNPGPMWHSFGPCHPPQMGPMMVRNLAVAGGMLPRVPIQYRSDMVPVQQGYSQNIMVPPQQQYSQNIMAPPQQQYDQNTIIGANTNFNISSGYSNGSQFMPAGNPAFDGMLPIPIQGSVYGNQNVMPGTNQSFNISSGYSNSSQFIPAGNPAFDDIPIPTQGSAYGNQNVTPGTNSSTSPSDDGDGSNWDMLLMEDMANWCSLPDEHDAGSNAIPVEDQTFDALLHFQNGDDNTLST